MKTPTSSQWKAVRAADHHLLVAAGAGTGKTSTVVARILYLLGVEMHGERYPTPLALDRIGAITYTNAAAADLKRKLRDELRAAGLRDAAYQVDNARIGTIHGFCGDLLRESALRAGRAPGFEVLEEGEGGALAAEAARDALVAAVAEGGLDGLEALLSVHRQKEVEEFVGRLVADGDRLARMATGTAIGEEERALLAVATRARELMERRLEEQGAVDFDRMITWTRDLLRDDPAIRRRLQRRLHTLIVDEFQDVDPVQKEIAWLLGDPDSGRADTTRLMLVGDPKQSIYRFRRADVTVWRSVEQAFLDRTLGEVVPLQDNFRSVAPILAFVDAAVGPVLDAPINGQVRQDFEVGYLPVSPVPATVGPADQAVEVLLVPTDSAGDDLKADERRAAEAEAMAMQARELHANGVAFRQMAALFASLKGVDVYQDALTRAGIRTYLLRGEGFYERREVLDLLVALRAVRDPRDDEALYGFLRSPFVALRDETLLELAWQGAGQRWDALAGATTSEPERLARGVALIEEHAALRDRVPVHELLERMLEKSGYLGHLALQCVAGSQAIANVRKFVRLARRHEGISVGDFLRMVNEIRARGDREGDERLFGQQDDVMTLTTVHSAKGLEWDVVFWCDLGRKARVSGGRDDVLLIGRKTLALKDSDAGPKGPQPQGWTALKSAEDAESAAERKRLWYVASTRAKQRLILSGVAEGGGEKSSAGFALLGRFGLPAVHGAAFKYTGQGGREFSGTVRLAPMVPEAAPAETSDSWGTPLPATVPAQVEPLPSLAGPARHSATSLLAWRRCPHRHWLRYVAGLKEPEVERAGQEYLGAIARGQVVHEVLERLQGEEEFDELLEAAIGRWDEGAPPPDTEAGVALRQRLAEEVALVADHPDYRAVAGAPGARRELAFTRVLGADTHLEGKIDLAAPEGAGLVLLDVKTTQRPDDQVEAIARRYAIQRAVYVEAAEAIGGMPVERFAFQFSRAARQVSVPIGAGERAEGRRMMEEALGGIAEGRAPFTESPLECRYCGYRAAGWCPGVEGGG